MPPVNLSSTNKTDDKNLVLHVDQSHRGTINSQQVFHTEVETIKNLTSRSNNDQKKFQTAKEDEIKFLL